MQAVLVENRSGIARNYLRALVDRITVTAGANGAMVAITARAVAKAA
jgi:hypothetical protein